MTIDTSPAALRKLADDCFDDYEDVEEMRAALRAVADEKEAQNRPEQERRFNTYVEKKWEQSLQILEDYIVSVNHNPTGGLATMLTGNDAEKGAPTETQREEIWGDITPQPKPAPVLLTDVDIDGAWRSVDPTASYKSFRMSIGRAIESAVLRKNGIGGE